MNITSTVLGTYQPSFHLDCLRTHFLGGEGEVEKEEAHSTCPGIQVTQLTQDPQLVGMILGKESGWSGLSLPKIRLSNPFCLYSPDFSVGTCSPGLDLGQSGEGQCAPWFTWEAQQMALFSQLCPLIFSSSGLPPLPFYLHCFSLALGHASLLHLQAFFSAWALTWFLPLSYPHQRTSWLLPECHLLQRSNLVSSLFPQRRKQRPHISGLSLPVFWAVFAPRAEYLSSSASQRPEGRTMPPHAWWHAFSVPYEEQTAVTQRQGSCLGWGGCGPKSERRKPEVLTSSI